MSLNGKIQTDKPLTRESISTGSMMKERKKKFIMRLIPIEVEMEIGKILFLVYDYNAEIELNIHQAAREMEE